MITLNGFILVSKKELGKDGRSNDLAATIGLLLLASKCARPTASNNHKQNEEGCGRATW
jgi:hypothetical protein